MSDDERAAHARLAWRRLALRGGLITRPEVRVAWQISRPRSYSLTNADYFPPVIDGTNNRRAVWLTADVEYWRLTWRPPAGPKAHYRPLLNIKPDPPAARHAWHVLADTGGLVTCQSLAQTWGISETAVQQRTRQPGFPPPVLPGRWLTAEALAAYPS